MVILSYFADWMNFREQSEWGRGEAKKPERKVLLYYEWEGEAWLYNQNPSMREKIKRSGSKAFRR